MKNYYEVLQVDEYATLEEIKKSYRKLALRFHPDKNKESNAHDLFIEIGTAYEILSNPIKRAEYDDFLKRKRKQKENNRTTREEKYTTEYDYNYRSEKAEKYANMSYEDFKNKLDKVIKFGKNVKKTTELGCLGIVAFLMMILGFLSVLKQLFENEKINVLILILSIFSIVFGYFAMLGVKDDISDVKWK